MSQHFSVMDTNPNEATDGKGCLCYENGGPDTKGPYIVFNHTEMDTIRSPFPVLCANCARHAYNDLQVDKQEPPITAADIAAIDAEVAARSARRRRKTTTDDIPEV